MNSFAVIIVPEFALQAVVRINDKLDGQPCALMEGFGKKALVAQLNTPALQSGVQRGMTAPQALARWAEMAFFERSATGEKSAREALITAAFTLSPRVEETGEGVCTVDLKGVRIDNFIHCGRRVTDELLKLGLNAKIGFARNPLLALYAAHSANPVMAVENEAGFLAGLPISIAGPPPHIAEILSQWGMKTLGALSALPRQEVAKRLGDEGIVLWDRARGRDERVLKLVILPEEFEEEIELEQEMETLEPLLFILRRFIGQLALRLSAVCKVAEELKLELTLTDDSKYERAFRLPEPARDPDMLFRMLHTHLEGVRTDSPIMKIRLWIKPCRPVSRQRDFFEAAVKDPSGFSDTLARLVALVGSGNVGSPRLEPTHRPDAFRMEPFAPADVKKWTLEESSNRGYQPVSRGMPMRRYRPPPPALVFLENGRPGHVRSDVISGRIQKAEGPWRLSGNWWEPNRWARDEWDIELAKGGLFRLVQAGKNWFVEGEYG